MSERPWLKWYPSDWRGDALLRVCSLAARGLWIEMLGVMHENGGRLLLNGSSPSQAQIAAVVGSDAKTVGKLLKELEDNGVFSRDDAGVIFSRRMVRDLVKSAEGKKWVEKRWGNRLERTEVDRSPTGRPNRSPDSPPTGSPITPEARSQKPDSPPTPQALIAGVTPCRQTGKATVNGFYLDATSEHVLELARINPAQWRGDYQPVIAWLRDGITPETIYAGVKRVASRSDYKLPFSLKFFDKAVREQPQETAA